MADCSGHVGRNINGYDWMHEVHSFGGMSGGEDAITILLRKASLYIYMPYRHV